MMPRSLHIDELTSPEIAELIQNGYHTVIVPLGATEQHGPALPLIVDNEHGLATSLRAAQVLGKTLVGPVMTLGYSPEHVYFPGTISLSHQTVAGMIRDIAESHARSGFRLVYFWVGHGGNFGILQEVLNEVADLWPPCKVTGLRDIATYVADTWDKLPLVEGIGLDISGSHAGEFETSIMLSIRPDLVRTQQAEAGSPKPLAAIMEKMMGAGIQAVSPNGVLGDQRSADAARGSRYLDGLAKWLVDDLRLNQEKFL